MENIIKFLDHVNENKLANQVLSVFGKNAISFDQFDEVSRCFFKIKNYKDSIKFGEMAYAIASTPEQMYIIRSNLINVYNHFNFPELALRYIKANEVVLPDDIDRDFEKAFALFLSNKKTEAGNLLRSLLNKPLSDEQRTKCNFNIGTYDLIDGNFQEGLKRFLFSGEEMGIWNFLNQKHETYGLPRWNGIIKPGIKLIVIAEAGIGDEIINVRFFNLLKEYGIEPIWLTLKSRSDLAEIYRLNGINAVSDIKEINKDFLKEAYYTPSMQLPINLNINYQDLWHGPYLTNFKNTIDLKSNKLKIGLRWQGNPSYDQDLHRSIPLQEILNSINIDKELIKLYSIQRDTGLEELNDIDNVIDLSDKLKDIHDLFSVINNLDLVITSCTSVAHIAAAMGKEVCIILPISCYYTWCQPGNKTGWYGDNVHLFYQEKSRSWKEPLEKLSLFLQENYGNTEN